MIELKFAGRVPIRSRGEGRTPVPGWTGDHEWQGQVLGRLELERRSISLSE